MKRAEVPGAVLSPTWSREARTFSARCRLTVWPTTLLMAMPKPYNIGTKRNAKRRKESWKGKNGLMLPVKFSPASPVPP